MNVVTRARAVTATVRRTPGPALLFTSVLGWATLVWLTATTAAAGAGHAAHAVYAGHVVHGNDPGLTTDAVTAVAGVASASHGPAMWFAMVVAMSPLLLLREVSLVWNGSLRRTRALTVLVFACGYVLAWIAAGLVAFPVATAAASVWLGWSVAVLVAVWHCSPLRQRCLNVCHRTRRLRAFGAGAQTDAWRYGAVTGAACAATCGPLMVLVLLAAHAHLLAMAGATVLLMIERYRPGQRPRWRLPFAPARPEHMALRDLHAGQSMPA